MSGFGGKDKSKKSKKSIDAKESIQQIANKGIHLHLKGNISEASKYYQYCINIGINDHRVYSNYGAINKDIGNLKEAERLTKKAIKINPYFVNAYHNLGSILIDMGKFKDAELITRKAIKISPNDANFYQKLGIILIELNKLSEAEISFLKAIEINPVDPISHQNLAIIMIENKKLSEAEIYINKAIKFNPDYAIGYCTLSSILINCGKNEEAEKSLLKSIKLKPNLAKSYYLSSTINLLQKNQEMIEILFSKRILRNQKEIDLIDIYFARANLLEKQNNYLEASDFLKKANNLNLKVYGSDYLDFKSKIKSFFINPRKNIVISNSSNDAPIPIFIVGMPRSGKSITESILACNDKLNKLGEEDALDSAIKIYLENKDKTSKLDLFKLYLEHLREYRANDSFICSTTPLNLIYTGLIISEIETAKIIFCYRNPLDNIIKIYQKHMGSKHTYSCSIIESANMWLETYLLMEHYSELNKSSIYFLNYDNLIKEQKTESKKLINWLGWKYSDKYLRPSIDISTLSNSDSLNDNEISIWRNYRDILSPAIKIFEKHNKFKTLIQ